MRFLLLHAKIYPLPLLRHSLSRERELNVKILPAFALAIFPLRAVYFLVQEIESSLFAQGCQ